MSSKARFLNDSQLINALCMSELPTAVLVLEEAVIEIANEAMIMIWGKGPEVIGKSLQDALPELSGQKYLKLFKEAWNKGIDIACWGTPTDMLINGELKTFYLDYQLRAIKNDKGQTYAILHTAKDVTWRYRMAGKEIPQLQEISLPSKALIASNHELAANIGKLAAIEKELLATKEELAGSKKQLEKFNNNLAAREEFFRSLIQQAPVGMCLINAGSLRVVEVNDAFLVSVGMDMHELRGRVILEIVPGFAEAYAPALQQVIKTGTSFAASEREVNLVRQGISEQVFVNYVFEPIRDKFGNVCAVMLVSYEVTELVKSRAMIAASEKRTRLVVDAAGAGFFDFELTSGKFTLSGGFKELFCLKQDFNEISLMDAIHHEDRPLLKESLERALETGRLSMEFRILTEDASLRWLRATGKVIFGDNSHRILGSVVDITEVKTLQNQKDDFISMAGHELKTPVTSLKASIQLIARLQDKLDHKAFSMLILQATRSIERIGYLIEDLLNVRRLQQYDMPLNRTHFPISKLIDKVPNLIDVAGTKITVIGDKDLKVYADEHWIGQVLAKLVGNAIKYAPLSPKIEICIQRKNSDTLVLVVDEGPGIPSERISHIFDRYARSSPLGNYTSGLGLGLFISAQIIRKHGGHIGVESAPGKGSKFWFTLPGYTNQGH